MKKLAGLVLLLAILILGGYYGMGVATEHTLKKSINKLDTVNQVNGVHVEVTQYHRGWFTSTADLKLKLHIAERVIHGQNGQSSVAPAKDYTFNIPLKIDHGPVVFHNSQLHFGLGYANSSINLPQEYLAQWNTLFLPQSTQPTLDLTFVINYTGSVHFQLSVPTFKLFSKLDMGQFEWLGLSNNTNLSPNEQTVEGDFTLDGINFSKEQTTAKLKNVTSKYALHNTPADLYLGHGALTIQSLLVQNNTDTLFSLTDLSIDSESDINDALFHTAINTSIDKMVVNNKNYGPGKLSIALKNLDADVLATIHKQMAQMQQVTDSERQQALIGLLPEIPKLFSKGPVLEISTLHFVMAEGTVDANMTVSLPPQDVSNPFQLIQQIQGQGTIELPKAILKQAILPAAKQALTAAKKTKDATDDKPAQPVDNTATTATSEAIATATSATAAAPTTNMGIEQQATAMVEKKLADLVQAQVLLIKGDNYLIKLQLAHGQLLINGKTADPALFKF